MGVLDVTYKISRTLGVASTDGKTSEVQAHLTQQVTVTDPVNDNEAVVLSDPRVMYSRMPHPYQYFARAANVTCRRISPVMYEVDADFSTLSGAGRSPLLNPPDVTFSAVVTDEEIDQDINSYPIFMFATGERFTESVRRPTYDPVVRVNRNMATVDPVLISTYRNSVNSDSWYGFPPGTVRITTLDYRSVVDSDFTYYIVDAEFQIRRGAPRTTDDKAWYVRRKAQGIYVNLDIFGVGITARMRGIDDNGNETITPVPHKIYAGTGPSGTNYEGATDAGGSPILAPDGRQYSGQQILPGKEDDCEWYEFQIYQPLPYAALNII